MTAPTLAKPLVYVAGPITGDPFGCVRQAAQAFDHLRAAGLVPFLPQLSVIQEMVAPQPYEVWMAFDFDVIRCCEALVRLSGESPGADREVEFATELGLPVFGWENASDIAKVNAWLQLRSLRMGGPVDAVAEAMFAPPVDCNTCGHPEHEHALVGEGHGCLHADPDPERPGFTLHCLCRMGRRP